jgi:hypothetical protein
MYSASKPRMNSGANRARPLRNNVMPNAEPNTIIPPAGPDFMQIPLVISRNKNITPFAKLLYGRLILYAGKNEICTPSHETLAAEIGTSSRYVKTLLVELRECGLIDWNRRRTSNTYSVRNPSSYHDRNPSSQLDRNPSSYKKMSLNRGSGKDVALACATLTHRAVNVPQTPIRKIEEYPNLRKLLAQFMANMQALRPEHYPSHQQVAELVHACEVEGLGESWIQKELAFLYNVKGVRYGVTNGPYSFKWFISTLSGRASEEIERRDARSESVWDHDGIRMVS